MQKYEFGRSRALSKPLAAVYTQTASLLLIYFYFITNHTFYFSFAKTTIFFTTSHSIFPTLSRCFQLP